MIRAVNNYTTSLEHLKRVPEDFPKVVTCASANELGALLTDGFKAWQRYRDQVIRKVDKE